MSLQFIIDGYNIINHPLFRTHTTKKTEDSRTALLEFIRRNKPCGSPKNKISIIFDGHSNTSIDKMHKTDIDIVFSRKETADERIRRLVEKSNQPKNTVVVSDDKEIRFFVKSLGAKVMSVEDFIKTKEKLPRNNISLKPELTYTQMHKINQELRKIWLK